MSKKKILIYAHYYAPDVASTGQLLKDLAEGILSEFDVTVICTVPSYTGTVSDAYRDKKFYIEDMNGVKVIRVPVPEFTKSSKKSRIKNLAVYYLNARKAAKLSGVVDCVFTISQPPIMGGMLGIYARNRLRNAEGRRPKLIYCIQDFNPEQTAATGYFKLKPLLSVASFLDKRTCRKSDLVITVGRDLVDTLRNRFKGGKVPNYTMINNWIDEKEIYPLSFSEAGVEAFRKEWGLEGKFVIMYSGNIGLYYDLEGLISVMAGFKGARTPDGREVVFAFVGAGSVLDKLLKYKEENDCDNMIFIPYQDKDKLIYSLNAADVHWCVNAKGIKGVSCPSKFYGIIGVGKPVMGVLEKGSEICMLMEETGCGLIAEPGDYDKVSRNLDWFIKNAGTQELAEMGRKGHDYLVVNLTKDISIAKYTESIKALGL
ncbi:MAG: glycosyltransferase family 4 protein [Lachnospiraceae bacterium]|nr:glycosyltransferase family 4 protein [Lachnospiraceae bacterium]